MKCVFFFIQDDEADDSDRLVIDEGDQYSNSDLINALTGKLDEMQENELPECQGCKKREAQFVCADCKRQWYCSRECQVSCARIPSDLLESGYLSLFLSNIRCLFFLPLSYSTRIGDGVG